MAALAPFLQKKKEFYTVVYFVAITFLAVREKERCSTILGPCLPKKYLTLQL